MNDIRTVDYLANKFRDAIEKCVFESPPMNRFPLGCCGEASILLSQYFIDCGISAHYQYGEFIRGVGQLSQSHAWIVLNDGIIVDITGDQFKDYIEFDFYNIPVYVGEETKFHKSFRKGPLLPGGFNRFDTQTADRFSKLYKIIVSTVSQE